MQATLNAAMTECRFCCSEGEYRWVF